jgi:hypothetical protein
MLTSPINRAQFLRRAAAAGLLATAAPLVASSNHAYAAPAGRGLTFRGVSYDVGTADVDGVLSRLRWHHPQIASELATIRHGLHGNTVTLLGSHLGRFAETGTLALQGGLHAVIQPRLFDHPQSEIMAQLEDAARLAERLRREHPKPGVTLAVGCEHILFTPGIVPGADLWERAAYLEKHPEEYPAIVRRLNEFLGRQVELARRHFRGPLTYGAAVGLEQVDWRPFDIVGLDYYQSHPTADGHRQALAPYRRWNKPIWILEFGCCTFEGADADAGMGWNIFDTSKEPPEIPAEVVRSERTQAAHLTRTLAAFETLDLYGASVYTFVSPDLPHSRPKKYDYDIAAYSLLKSIRASRFDEESPYYTLPKHSFAAVARHNLAHRR